MGNSSERVSSEQVRCEHRHGTKFPKGPRLRSVHPIESGIFRPYVQLMGPFRPKAQLTKDRMSTRQRDAHTSEMIALIPAAGHATRIWPLPCSKEVYPVGLAMNRDATSLRPKVTCHYLLEKMRMAGIKKGFIILRDGKWDIPAYCGDGTFVDMHIAYLTVRHSSGPPYTLDQAFPFVQGAHIAFGFPDILFRPDDVFVQLKNKLQAAKAQVVLGLFPAADHRMMDMVEIDSKGRVTALYIKPHRTPLKYAWLCAVWSPSFTQFLHQYLRSLVPSGDTGASLRRKSAGRELSVGHVLQAAVNQGLLMQTVLFKGGQYVDMGTPEGLRSVSRITGSDA